MTSGEKPGGAGIFSALALLSEIGLTMAGCVAMMMGVGWMVEKLIDTGGLITVLFGLAGAAMGFMAVYRRILKS